MRISEFLSGLAEEQMEKTPAQQSIDTQVVQTNVADPVTPENEKTGETIGDPTASAEQPQATQPIETSPEADGGVPTAPTSPDDTPPPADGEPDVDLSKDAEDEGEDDDADDSTGGDVDQEDSGAGDGGAVDQEDQDMEQEKQLKESMTFAEQFEASLNEGTEFKLEMALDGLFESQGFEAEFASQAKEIFEAAVNDAAKQHMKNVNKYAAHVMENLMAEKLEEVESIVDARLNEAVATWVESNRVAVENGIRTQVAESFMGKLKDLLAEHFVEVPTVKKDMYEEKAAEVDSLKAQLTESEAATQSKVATLSEEIRALRKQVSIDSFVRGMTLMQSEKIRSLAEGITYDTEESFVGKLTILRESYVAKPKSKNVDTLVEDVTPVVEEKKEVPQGDPMILALAQKIRH